MNKLFRAFAVALILMPSWGLAQDFDKGLAAFEVGDYETALEEWRPLANQGDANAQTNLGIMFINGYGVEQDLAKGSRLIRLAAEQGFAEAQYGLGGIYLIGKGVPRNLQTSYMWLSVASSNGYADANELRDGLPFLMTPEQIAEAQRRARVCVASNYTDCD